MSQITISKVQQAADALAKTPVFDEVDPAAAQTAAYLQHSGRATRIGLWALAIGFGGFLAWSILAPLDEGVPGAGTVAIDTKRKVIQHPSGGIIREVLVREGDIVKAGQVVMRLDEAAARANFEQVRQRYLGLRAMQGRLQAEWAKQSSIEFHPDVREAVSDPEVAKMVHNQQQLLTTRRNGLQAELASLNESAQGIRAQNEALRAVRVNRARQLALLEEELAALRDLVREGYAPRNRQLELERQIAEVRGALEELGGNLARNDRSIAELGQRTIAREQDYRKEVESQLADVGREVEADAQRYRAGREDLERIDIRSPVDGQVMGLAYQTVGGVIGAGQRLMDVVPQGQPLLVEARVAPHLIDRVKAGLPVDVRFSSFAHSPQLVVAGSVVSVSADLMQDQPNVPPYFLARVAVTDEGRKELGQRQLQPGMPVEVVFKTGERSMLKYLLNPLTRRLAASMKEE